jgi:hypothetical protein
MAETAGPGDASPVANPMEGEGIDPGEEVFPAYWNDRLYQLLGRALEATEDYSPDREKIPPDPRVLAAISAYRSDTHQEPQPMPPEPPILPGPSDGPVEAGDATVDISRAVGAWVYISSFAGIAIAWSTSLAAPWVGGLLGAILAFVAGTCVIAARG